VHNSKTDRSTSAPDQQRRFGDVRSESAFPQISDIPSRGPIVKTGHLAALHSWAKEAAD
jgi:hypothetical protein